MMFSMFTINLSSIPQDLRRVLLEIIATDGARERKVEIIVRMLFERRILNIRKRFVDYILRPADDNARRDFEKMFEVHGESELCLFCESFPEKCELVLL